MPITAYSNEPLEDSGGDRYVMFVSGLGVGRARTAEEMVASGDAGEAEMVRAG
jgi:hypothetical protein